MARKMTGIEKRHLKNLFGGDSDLIDLHAHIDHSLTYAENKRLLLLEFGGGFSHNNQYTKTQIDQFADQQKEAAKEQQAEHNARLDAFIDHMELSIKYANSQPTKISSATIENFMQSKEAGLKSGILR